MIRVNNNRVTPSINLTPNFKGSKSFFMIKPDAIKKGVENDIIDIVKQNGLKINKMEKTVLSREVAAKHYEEHAGKPFFEGLLDFITSGPVIKIEVEGKKHQRTAKKLRSLAPELREKFATDKQQNAVHTSDSISAAKRELELHFPKKKKKLDTNA